METRGRRRGPLQGHRPSRCPCENRRRKDIVTRTRYWYALVALLVVATTTLTVVPPIAGATTLSEQLRASRRALRRADTRLETAKAALSAAILAHQQRGTGVLVLKVRAARRAVRSWKAVVRGLLARRTQQAAAASGSAGSWRPEIRRAAEKYGVSAAGLYRLMMLESGGKARAVGAGRYYGLFQYALGTWKGDWNPCGGRNVFNGAAQIEATAYAVKKGMGRSMWGNTYPAAF